MEDHKCQSPTTPESVRAWAGAKTTAVVRAAVDRHIGVDRGLCLLQRLELSAGWIVLRRSDDYSIDELDE